jgi:DNA-directed RNA polymerase specialized sigma54-like protein
MQTTFGRGSIGPRSEKHFKEAINNEDKQKPITDERLTEILLEKGYQLHVAR